MRANWTLLLVGLGCASVVAPEGRAQPDRAAQALSATIEPEKDVIVRVARANLELQGQPIARTVAGTVFPARRVEKNWVWIDFGWIRRDDVLPLDGAVEYFTEQIRRRPTALGYLVRGAALSRQGEDDKALADFQAALRLEPRNAVVYLARGQARAALGQTDEALADYTQALVLDAALGEALMARGSLHCDRRAFQDGIRDFTALIKLAPRDARGYILRATAWGELDDADHELADASAAIALLPTSDMAYALRADAYRLKGDHQRALADYTEALRLNPLDVDNRVARALIWEQQGELEKAIADVDRAIEISPYSVMAYTNRGWMRVAQGRFAEALADFDKTIELSPHSAGAWNNKAWLLATCEQDSIRNGAGALAAATKACELTEWNDSSSLETFAAAKAELGDFAEAVRRQTDAVRLSPPELKAKAELRLKLYQEGKPCRGEAAKP